jgi:hypothetical protein
LVVLWAILFVAFAVIGIARMVQTGQEESLAMAQLFKARQLAQNAAVLGLHPAVEEGDPLLKGNSELGGAYEVVLTSEGARININEILKAGKRDVLERLFEKWGIPDSEAAVAADSLLDWVDADPFTRLNGAERDFYEQKSPGSKFPLNTAFATVEEMAFVRGMDEVAAKKPDWQDAFTVWSDGKLDLNDAPAELIEAVGGVTEAQALQLVEVRTGMRALADTKLRRWKDVSEPLSVMGLGAVDIARLQTLVTVESGIWRAESTGTVAGKSATVAVIFHKGHAQESPIYRLEK